MNQPRAADYSVTHLAQCDGERGVCPDQRVGGSNDVVLGTNKRATETSNSKVTNQLYLAVGTYKYLGILLEILNIIFGGDA